jgi:hypothetical protein
MVLVSWEAFVVLKDLDLGVVMGLEKWMERILKCQDSTELFDLR